MKNLIKWVDCILFREWDPIGIRDEPGCIDEYSSYAPAITEMVVLRTAPELIANHLDAIATQLMGCKPNPENTYRVALILLRPFVES